MYKLGVLFFCIPTFCFSQLQELEFILEDLVILTNNFIEPSAEGSTYQAASGWYTSAKEKELWDLEISVQGSMLFLPSKNNTFLIDESKLQNLTIQGPLTIAETPTSIGGTDVLTLEGVLGGQTFDFTTPEGLDESTIIHTQLQANLGLWAGTSLIVRYSPKMKIKKTNYEIFGFGFQHNISQWIPTLKSSSFDIALNASYADFKIGNNFKEVDIQIGSLNTVEADGKSIMFSLIASKEIKKFQITSAIGFTKNTFEYNVGGTGDLLISTLNNALKAVDNEKNTFKADVGVLYNLNNFSINSILTIGSYSNLLIGINYNL